MSVSSFEQVNDTVGALSLGYYHDPDTVVAVVFGTGSNACYLERTDAIIKCQGLLTTSGSMVLRIISSSILNEPANHAFRSREIYVEHPFFVMFQVVNMEWGNFWSSHLPRTSYDIDLDAESSNSNDMVIFA